MACDFICDGCGKVASGWSNGQSWFKPPDWYQRSDKDGTQVACSRSCIDLVAAKSGKTSVVMPI